MKSRRRSERERERGKEGRRAGPAAGEVTVGRATTVTRSGTKLWVCDLLTIVAENESASIALQKAIEEAVLKMIQIGFGRNYWTYE